MMLKEIILLPTNQQDQLIIIFLESFIYNINHRIIFHIRPVVLMLMIMNSVINIMERDQKTFRMVLAALLQYLTEVQ